MAWEAEQDSSLHGGGASMRQVVYLDTVLLQQGTEDGMMKSAKHVKPNDFPFFISSLTISYHFFPLLFQSIRLDLITHIPPSFRLPQFSLASPLCRSLLSQPFLMSTYWMHILAEVHN